MPVSWPTAGELMTGDPVTLPLGAPLSQALGIMRSRAIHELPVLRRSRLIGMITFESIARRTFLPLTTKVEHLMILPPIVTPQTPYPELAEQLLAAGIRAAPVVGRKGELVGVVSRTDLVRALPQIPMMADHRVEEIQSSAGMVVKETDRCGGLFAQIRTLEEHPLPVVDRKGKLVGAVGIADLGRVLWKPVAGGKRDAEHRGSVYDVEVGTIMRSPALTVVKGTSTGEAARRMTAERVSSVFVEEGGKPVGVVSQRDLLGLAVGRGEPIGRGSLGDVYVQITGLRGSSDPTILTEIDHVVAKGLRRVARHAQPSLLSLHFAPHATHRSTDATVEARLHTDRGSFYASKTGWNFFGGIAEVMADLTEQARRARRSGKELRGRGTRASAPDETLSDPELEAKMRAASGGDSE